VRVLWERVCSNGICLLAGKNKGYYRCREFAGVDVVERDDGVSH
jgi:hypothetical protein